MVFKLSQVEQFQVMTKYRVWPQEWAAERTSKGRSLAQRRSRCLEAGVDVVMGTRRPPLLEPGKNTAPKPDARVFTEEGGVTG